MNPPNHPSQAVAHERILVPLDGSEAAEGALRYAAVIPSQSVRLLAVEPVVLTAARTRWAQGQVPPSGGTWLVSSVADYLDAVGFPLRAQGRNVEVVVMTGEPGPRIVEAARDAALIVLAARGHGLTRQPLGGTAGYVVRHAGVPTLVLSETTVGAPPAVLRVVVPLDGSTVAEEAIPIAATFRQGFAARMHLFRAVDPAASIGLTSDLEREAEDYLEGWIRRLGAGGDGPSCEVRVGRADERLLETLRPGDLVTMTTRGRGGLGRLILGNVTAAVIKQAPVPVVLVRAVPGEMASALAMAAGRGGRRPSPATWTPSPPWS